MVNQSFVRVSREQKLPLSRPVQRLNTRKHKKQLMLTLIQSEAAVQPYYGQPLLNLYGARKLAHFNEARSNNRFQALCLLPHQ